MVLCQVLTVVSVFSESPGGAVIGKLFGRLNGWRSGGGPVVGKGKPVLQGTVCGRPMTAPTGGWWILRCACYSILVID